MVRLVPQECVQWTDEQMVREFFDMFTSKAACLAGLHEVRTQMAAAGITLRCKQVGLLSNVLPVHGFLVCRENNVSPDTCAAGVATQPFEVLALVMRVCVQLLLNRGAMWLSSENHGHTHMFIGVEHRLAVGDAEDMGNM